MDNLTKLQNIIKDSSLSNEDKNFWSEVFSMKKAPSFVIESMLEYIQTKPDDLVWLTDYLKRKFDAFEQGDKEALNKILEEEKEKLNETN